MKFEFDTDEIANGVVEEVLNREIDGKTIRQWMDEIKNRQWISVRDRLPEDDREVLAAYKITEKGIKRRGVETASCIAGNGEVDWVSLWDEYRIPNGSKRVITHWMPLPEPPKEESND